MVVVWTKNIFWSKIYFGALANSLILNHLTSNNTLDIYDVFLFLSRIPKYSKHIGLNSPLSDVAEFIKSLFMSLSETRNIFFETLESRIPENTPE